MLLEQMLLEERNEGIEQGIEIGTEKGIQQGIEIGKEESIKKLAIRHWENGRELEDIAEICSRSPDTIREWIAGGEA